MIKNSFFERKCFKFRFNCQTNPCQVPYIASDYQNYPFPVFLLKRKVPEKIYEYSGRILLEMFLLTI